MTYHVTCPYSNKVYSRETLVDMRKFVFAMMVKMDCRSRVWIRDGKVKMGSMWKIGDRVMFRTKGVRTPRQVYRDGTIRRKGI